MLTGRLVRNHDLAEATGTNVAESVIVFAKIQLFLKEAQVDIIRLQYLKMFQIILPLISLLSLPFDRVNYFFHYTTFRG